jgi:hypothetical protein
MSVFTRYPAVTLLAVLLGGVAHAQDQPPEVLQPSGPEVPAVSPAYSQAPAGNGQPAGEGPRAGEGQPGGDGLRPPPGVPGLDDWMLYHRPSSCFCPVGGDGPIQTELYLRAGVSFPVGGGVYSRILQTGWEIQGGGRALFFNTARDAAWVVDLGVVNIWNHSNRPDVLIPLSVAQSTTGAMGAQTIAFLPLDVTAAALNRTFGSASLGKEWWLTDPATAPCNRLRWGVDLGGRYGSNSATFHEIRHRTDVIGAAFIALHADLEIPCGCCTFIYGLRTEYQYSWSDILQSQNSGDLADFSLLVNFGVRF